MGAVKLDVQDNVAVLTLDRSVTNPLNLEFLIEIRDNLEKLELDDSVGAIVLTSGSEKFFCIGFDLPELFDMNEKDVKLFYTTFNRLCIRLYTIAKPTIAALKGHAIAGGCILALCADYRYIADGRKLMGLNEVKLGLSVPYPADRILHALVGGRNAREILEFGEFFEPEVAKKLGMVDLVLPQEDVLEKAVERARALGAMPVEAFKMIKRNRTELVEEQILARLDEKERFFLERWNTEEVRERIKDAIEKF